MKPPSVHYSESKKMFGMKGMSRVKPATAEKLKVFPKQKRSAFLPNDGSQGGNFSLASRHHQSGTYIKDPEGISSFDVNDKLSEYN